MRFNSSFRQGFFTRSSEHDQRTKFISKVLEYDSLLKLSMRPLASSFHPPHNPRGSGRRRARANAERASSGQSASSSNPSSSRASSSLSTQVQTQAAAAATMGAAAAATESPGLWGRLSAMIGKERVQTLQAKVGEAKEWATTQRQTFKMPSVDVQIDFLTPNLKRAQAIALEAWDRVPAHYKPVITHVGAGIGGAFLAHTWTLRSVHEEAAKRTALQTQVAAMLRERDAREAFIERLKNEGPNHELELRYAQTIAQLSRSAVEATQALMTATGHMRAAAATGMHAHVGGMGAGLGAAAAAREAYRLDNGGSGSGAGASALRGTEPASAAAAVGRPGSGPTNMPSGELP